MQHLENAGPCTWMHQITAMKCVWPWMFKNLRKRCMWPMQYLEAGNLASTDMICLKRSYYLFMVFNLIPDETNIISYIFAPLPQNKKERYAMKMIGGVVTPV